MYAITNINGNKTTLFNDINLLYNEYKQIFNFYNLKINSCEDIIKEINNKGYYKFELNNEIYYVIKTTVDTEIITFDNYLVKKV